LEPGNTRTAVFIAFRGPFHKYGVLFDHRVRQQAAARLVEAATRFLDPDLLQRDLHELADTNVFHPVDAEVGE
jgi:hypothetical protein